MSLLSICQRILIQLSIFLFPPSFSQQRLWLLYRLTGTTVNYNISSVFRQGSLFDLELLYDFRTDLFVDAFGIMDSLKQHMITQLRTLNHTGLKP